MKKIAPYILLAFTFLALALSTGCADAPAYEVTANAPHVYGFWGGFWHGLTVFWGALGALISDDIAIYAVSNNGGWYDFGFFFGVGGFGLFLRSITITVKNVG